MLLDSSALSQPAFAPRAPARAPRTALCVPPPPPPPPPPRARRRAAAAAAAAASRGAVAAGGVVKLVPYLPVERRDGYDLRLVQPHPVATVCYARRPEGFLALGSYMSGANAAGARFVETHPIVMRYPSGGDSDDGGGKTMSVYLAPRAGGEGEGAGGAGAAPPAPESREVRLDVGGGEVVAAARFEGAATREACVAAGTALRAALARDGLRLAPADAAGSFRLAQYGPLHSLTTRVNEIWLKVEL
jgi:hypothetical protein